MTDPRQQHGKVASKAPTGAPGMVVPEGAASLGARKVNKIKRKKSLGIKKSENRN